MFKRLNYLFVSMGLFPLANGQSVPAPKIVSPNVASINQYGEIPVSLFTGVPDISIPIYTLSYGAVSVPISLNYHPGSVRPAQHPGWVGLGWNLQSVGSISRAVRGGIDEGCCVNGTQDFPGYYPSPSVWSGSERIDVNNWYYNDSLKNYFTLPVPTPDVEADEFSFSVLGHSGKFFYGGPSKGWQVISNENIKVEIDGFLSVNEINGILSSYEPHRGIHDMFQHLQTRLFKGFILTVPDGTRFVFGGTGATELSTNYDHPSQGYAQIIADAWFLKQIIDVNNNVIDFFYRKKYLTVSLGFGRTNHIFSCKNVSDGFLRSPSESSSNGNIDAGTRSGRIQWPIYLEKIQCNSGTVNFQSAPATCKRYTNNQLMYWNENITTQAYLFDQTYLKDMYDIPHMEYFQWEQLNKIIVKRSNQEVCRVYKFTFNNTSNERLTLNVFEEQDKFESTIAKYQFAYTGIADLPLYDGNKTDHWGFFNKRELNGKSLTQISSEKNTDADEVNKGMLKSITYPTGGFTEFTWTKHDYSKVVSTERNSLSNVTGDAGGGRIYEIKSYTNTGELASSKTYYYKRNYTDIASANSLPSSGVLNGTPKYVFDITDRLSSGGQLLITLYYESIYSLANYSYNGGGSYIGYDEVVEVNADGSYTKHFFTNYGVDENLVTHFDRDADGSIGWKSNEDLYHVKSDLREERGKPTGIYMYNSNYTLVQKTRIKYRSDVGRFDDFVKKVERRLQFQSSCANYDALAFATATREYRYTYYPIWKEVTQYDQLGQNPIVATTTYNYNSNNIVSEQIEYDSENIPIKTQYKYPPDFPLNSTYQAMTTAHRLTPVIEETKLKDISQISLQRVNYFSPFAGIYVPQTTELQLANGPVQTKQLFNAYDNKGNIREMQNADDITVVYLWGYNSQYPVAKILGSDYATVAPLVSQSLLDDGANQSDATIRNALNTIRTTLTSAQVTTYTYSTLTGMTSETDPRGKTIFYEYDDFQRLKLVRDQDGNIIKTFKYQFKF